MSIPITGGVALATVKMLTTGIKINKLARRMNFAQEFFAVLFAAFYASLMAVIRNFGPFDTAGLLAYGILSRTGVRVFISCVCFWVFPAVYLYLGFTWLGEIKFNLLSSHQSIVAVILIVFFTSSIFGIWRVYFGLMLWKKEWFYSEGEYSHYNAKIQEDLKERPSSQMKPWNHIAPGIAWGILGFVLLYIFTKRVN